MCYKKAAIILIVCIAASATLRAQTTIVNNGKPVSRIVAGVKCESPSPVKARFIKVETEGDKTFLSWHYGVDYPCRFFLDEVTVL